MKVSLRELSRSAIEAVSGLDVGSGVELALRHYTARIGTKREPPRFPRFHAELGAGASGQEVDVPLGPDLQRALECAARGGAQGSPPPEQLAVHAVFVFLAELDRAGVEVLPASPRS